MSKPPHLGNGLNCKLCSKVSSIASKNAFHQNVHLLTVDSNKALLSDDFPTWQTWEQNKNSVMVVGDDHFYLFLPRSDNDQRMRASSPFHRRPAPLTSAAPQPSQHWPPAKEFPMTNRLMILIIRLIMINKLTLTFLLLTITLAPCLPRFCAIASLRCVWLPLSLSMLGFCLSKVIIQMYLRSLSFLPYSFCGGGHHSHLLVNQDTWDKKESKDDDNNKDGGEKDNDDKNDKNLAGKLSCWIRHWHWCGEASLRMVNDHWWS